MIKLILILLFICRAVLFSQDNNSFELKEGDLLFQDIDCGPLCDAIEKVTKGINGASFSHIGLIVKDSSNKIVVLEAVSAGVKLTELNDFLNRSLDKEGDPKVVAGRLKDEYRHLVPGIVSNAKEYIGEQYDNVYLFDNNKYYCSELIYLAAYKANTNHPVFELEPMTFKDPDTGEFYPAWINYYEELETNVPEGEPGLNPGGISMSDKLEIVHIYGYPEGWGRTEP